MEESGKAVQAYSCIPMTSNTPRKSSSDPVSDSLQQIAMKNTTKNVQLTFTGLITRRRRLYFFRKFWSDKFFANQTWVFCRSSSKFT